MAERENSGRTPGAMDFRDLFLFYIVSGISLRWIATAATMGASAVVFWLAALCHRTRHHCLRCDPCGGGAT
jgi:hypothetical protein